MKSLWSPKPLAATLCLLSWTVGCDGGERTLRVGTSGDYAPFSLAGEGFDVEVAQRFARDRGYVIEWVPFRWPELPADVQAGRFDVAMGGVTWRPERATRGFMTRAVAAGGPCVLGDPQGAPVAVNRGGVLERWARARWPDGKVRAVENLELPGLLAAGEVEAIVTDSFELESFQRSLAARGGSRAAAHCEPARDRKVYWVVPGRSPDLGPELDGWLASHEDWIASRRAHWMGEARPRDAWDHVADLLARRLALMPAVAAWKRARGRPLEDRGREARVLDAVARRARELGLPERPVWRLFELQIELAKRIQQRSDVSESLDLDTELRPLILALGARILAGLVALPSTEGPPPSASAPTWEPLRALLEPGEVARVVDALETLRAARAQPPSEEPSAAGIVPRRASARVVGGARSLGGPARESPAAPGPIWLVIPPAQTDN